MGYQCHQNFLFYCTRIALKVPTFLFYPNKHDDHYVDELGKRLDCCLVFIISTLDTVSLMQLCSLSFELFDIQRTHITVHHMLILDEQSYMCWVWTSATNIEYDRWLLLRLSSYCIKGTLQFILGLVHTSSGLVFQFSCLEAHELQLLLYQILL